MLSDKFIKETTDAVLALGAMVSITYLAQQGVLNLEVLGLLAGLGGYRMYKNKNGGGGE